jgi:uncharacterized membrane protein YkgB
MKSLINALTRLGLLNEDLDYEAQTLIPFISNGPLISWMYPVFGIRDLSAQARCFESCRIYFNR